MTDTSEAPIAYRMSTLKPRTSSGTMTTPPPSPVSAPRNPAATDPRQSSSVNSSTVINSPPGLGRRHNPTHTVQAEHPLTGSLWFLGVGVGYLPLKGGGKKSQRPRFTLSPARGPPPSSRGRGPV